MQISQEEIQKVQGYMQSKFGNGGITLRIREKAPDSVEVLLNGEFIGILYKDDEDGDVSYDFNMSILSIDI
jgi:hypothetical protein